MVAGPERRRSPRATPGKLSLPVIMDPVYGFQAVNVEAEMENASSLLHWTRRMIQTRKQHPCFGMGTFTDLGRFQPQRAVVRPRVR